MTPIAVVSVAAGAVLTAGSLSTARICCGLRREGLAGSAASTTPCTARAAPAITGEALDVPLKLER